MLLSQPMDRGRSSSCAPLSFRLTSEGATSRGPGAGGCLGNIGLRLVHHLTAQRIVVPQDAPRWTCPTFRPMATTRPTRSEISFIRRW